MCHNPTTARGCAGKIRFSSRSEAATRQQGFLKRGRTHNLPKPYYCDNCLGFHLGRNPKDRAPEPRAKIDMKSKARRYWDLVNGAL